MDPQLVCPHCKSNVSLLDFFCPTCGKKLKEKPLSTSWSKQLLVYLLSALLPPLGLWPAIKYLRQPDQKSKKIGTAAIILTVLSIILTIWLSANLVNSFSDKIGSQLNLLEGLEY